MLIGKIKIIISCKSNLGKLYRIRRINKRGSLSIMHKEKNQNITKEYILKILKTALLKIR